MTFVIMGWLNVPSKERQMKLLQYSDPVKYFQDIEPHLLESESVNNLIYGLSESVSILKDYPVDDLRMFSIKEGDEVLGAVLKTNKHTGLVLSAMESKVVEFLSQTIESLGGELNSVVGEKSNVDLFMDLTEFSEKSVMNQGIYEAVNIEIPNVSYEYDLQIVEDDFTEIGIQYAVNFHKDCFPEKDDHIESGKRFFERMLKTRSLYFLVINGQVVSMAAQNRGTKNTGCVSAVYTPPKFRRKGYGALVAALVSQKYLDNGKKACNLYTDLANPTSNSIYQKIGYTLIGYSKHIEFF